MKFSFAVLFLAMVVVATNAEDDRPICFCTREMAPVCATTGVTYANPCEFKCAKSQLVGRAADDFKIARGGACDGPEIPEFVRELK